MARRALREPTFTDLIELIWRRRPEHRRAQAAAGSDLADGVKAGLPLALEGLLPEEDGEDEALEESFPASDPVSTHMPNGDGHEPSGAPAARRWRSGCARPRRSRSRTGRRPSSTTDTS